MKSNLLLIFSIIFFSGCVELYEFDIKNDSPDLVIESFVSDISFQASRDFPSDGRYFYVNLSTTSDPTNVRDKVVVNASVSIVDNQNNVWQYTESDTDAGHYLLKDLQFYPKIDRSYKLHITLQDQTTYESSWQELPTAPKPSTLGEVSFIEKETLRYYYGGGKKVIRKVKGVEISIEVPENTIKQDIFYRWDFTPMWIYKAPLRPESICWATSPYYLNNFVLQKDGSGNYSKNLFFLEVDNNEKVFTKFSTIISQHIISEEHFQFWKIMNDQTGSNGLFDAPPSNLPTNFTCTSDPDKKAVGYFGVTKESAKRWYFSIDDLSYIYKDLSVIICSEPREPPPSDCYRCLEYTKGTPTDVQPVWWGQ